MIRGVPVYGERLYQDEQIMIEGSAYLCDINYLQMMKPAMIEKLIHQHHKIFHIDFTSVKAASTRILNSSQVGPQHPQFPQTKKVPILIKFLNQQLSSFVSKPTMHSLTLQNYLSSMILIVV